MMTAVVILSWAAAMILSGAEPAREPLWVELGSTDLSHGLTVPCGGDGLHQPEPLGGSRCRRVAGDKSHYMYVKADEGRVPAGCYDAYLAVEFYDDQAIVAYVQYDKVPVDKAKNSFYTAADDVIVGFDSRQWRRAVIHLPDARLGHGQNQGADLRLCVDGLAVRRIELLWSRPADYHPGGVDPARLEASRVHIGRGMELTFGTDTGRGQAAVLRSLGATSVESYVTWQTVEDNGKEQWDWSRWDRQVEILEESGLKWVPFLIAGPGYATPRWYRESERSVPYVCLEHGEASKIQSLWNPEWRGWVERFIRAFAQRYGDRPVIESVLLGVSGTYGETLYPAGPPPDGWTYVIPGPFHNHVGWWAGDRFAAADFRRYLQSRYGNIEALNRSWAAQHASFDSVVPFLPEKATSLQARFDMTQWYVVSMTDWAAFWVTTARKYLPRVPIYLCVGGAGEPELGADFSAQAEAIRSNAARIRITNEGSSYSRNFAVTREVATAARAFGLECGFEPASHVTADGNVARIYNATASGAIQLHCYHGNVLADTPSRTRFRQYASFLHRRVPQIHAGVYLAKTSWALDAPSARRNLSAVEDLRDRLDVELLDRATLPTRLGAGVKVLAVPEAPYVEAGELAAISEWVKAGGILVTRDQGERPLLRTIDGSDAGRKALLSSDGLQVEPVRLTVGGPTVRHFRLEIGSNGDADYLGGDWHGPEQNGEHTMRWTGAQPRIDVPCDPDADATLVLTAQLAGPSLAGKNQVFVNGKLVGTINTTDAKAHRFAVPKTVLAGRQVADVRLSIRTFRPRDHQMGGDTRRLGLNVWAVEMMASGAEEEPAATPALERRVDWSELKPCIRRIGKGATLAVRCSRDADFSLLVVETLERPENLIPGARGVVLPSRERDGIYATQCADGVLYLNTNQTPRLMGGVVVPAHGIANDAAQRVRPSL
jgi:hypothetical protein